MNREKKRERRKDKHMKYDEVSFSLSSSSSSCVGV
jgi:hypothetical protein